MAIIRPNTQKLYLSPNPNLVKDKFYHDGTDYYLMSDYALMSDYSNLPIPEGKGFYLKIRKGEFKRVKKLYLEKIQNTFRALECGYLKTGGVQTTFDF